MDEEELLKESVLKATSLILECIHLNEIPGDIALSALGTLIVRVMATNPHIDFELFFNEVKEQYESQRQTLPS